MSIEALSVAMNTDVGQSTRKLVLMAYANNAKKDGTAAWPGIDTVSQVANCDPRTAQRHVAALLADGFLREGDQQLVAHIPAARRPIVYDVAMSVAQVAEWKAAHDGTGRRAAAAAAGTRGGLASAAVRWGDRLSPQESEGDPTPEVDQRGDISDQGGVTPVSPKPSFEPPVVQNLPLPPPPSVVPATSVVEPETEAPPTAPHLSVAALRAEECSPGSEEQEPRPARSRSPRRPPAWELPGEMEAEFLAWYAAYPRPEDRGDARKAYALARQRASAEELLAGVRAYAALRAGQKPRWTKKPQNWLEGESWLNGPPAPEPMSPIEEKAWRSWEGLVEQSSGSWVDGEVERAWGFLDAGSA